MKQNTTVVDKKTIMKLLKVPFVPYNQRDWSLTFTTTEFCSAVVTLKGESGSKCQIYKSILHQRAIKLWKILRDKGLDGELELRVQASERTLLMFVNWIYNGGIQFLEFGGMPNPKSSTSCWHQSSIFTTACANALHMTKMGKADLLAHLDYQTEMEDYGICLRRYHHGTPQGHMEWLIELHLFAVNYDIDSLCEDALHALSIAIKVSNELPGWWLVDKAYNEAEWSSPLCQFLLTVYTTNWSCALAANLSSREDLQIHHKFSSSLICDLSYTLEDNKWAHEQEREKLVRSNDMQFEDHIFERDQLKKQLAESQAKLASAQTKIEAMEQEKRLGAETEGSRGRDDGEGILASLLRTASLSSTASSRTMV